MATAKSISLLFLAASLFSSTCFAQNNISVMGSFQRTKTSTGFGYGTSEIQSSRPSFSGGVEYRHAWGKNGISAVWNMGSTDAKFTSQYGVTQWGMTRQELNGGYVRTWQRRESPVTSYAKVGAGVFITNGGWAPGGVVGLDNQFEIVTEGGTDIRLTKGLSLRSGCAFHFYRAPNFSDPQYRGGRTVMVEPRIGITWAWH